MITDNHPITVPAGSINVWKILYRETYQGDLSETEYIATQAARWGADRELEACCEWLTSQGLAHFPMQGMLEARRPKPPTLKEQAMAALDDAVMRGDCITISDALPKIRRALEALPE